VDVTQVWLKAGGDVDGAEASLEAHDFEGVAGKLLPELLLPSSAFVEFLAGMESAAVDGRNESICDGVDGFVNVRVRAKEYFGSLGGHWGKFLLGLMGGGGERKGWGVFAGDDDSG